MTEVNLNALDAETLGMLADGLERYGQDKYSFKARKALFESPVGFGVNVWKEYARMGWLAAPMSIEDGGLNSDPAAIAELMRYSGKYLALEPLFASVVLCGRLLALANERGDETAREHLHALASGRRLFALAHAESLGDGMDGAVATQFTEGKLTGRKLIVLHGDIADELIISALDSTDASAGLSLFMVPASQTGVRKTSYKLLDGRSAASFEFDAVAATLVGPRGAGKTLLEEAFDHARLALCAEAHGAMCALNRLTLAYLKERCQFGRAIGTNQALQHRMVELFMLEQETAAVVFASQRAIVASGPLNGPMRKRAAMGAVAHTISAGRMISHEAVQMHGGMGTTDELAVSHYFKRIMVINRLLGDRDAHLDAFARADAARAIGAALDPLE